MGFPVAAYAILIFCTPESLSLAFPAVADAKLFLDEHPVIVANVATINTKTTAALKNLFPVFFIIFLPFLFG